MPDTLLYPSLSSLPSTATRQRPLTRRLATSLNLKLYAPLVELHLAEDAPAWGSLRPISNARAAFEVLNGLRLRSEEELWVLHLDSQNRLLARQLVTRGALNTTRTHPREIFRAAILNGSLGLVMAHNHPSGCPDPSPDDIEFTRCIVKAGELVGIVLLDHLIVAGKGWVSFRERGIL